MACRLTAPNHYLNQCWLIICNVPWLSSQGIIGRSEDTTSKPRLKIIFLKSYPDLPGTNALNHYVSSFLPGYSKDICCFLVLEFLKFIFGIFTEKYSTWIQRKVKITSAVQSIKYPKNSIKCAGRRTHCTMLHLSSSSTLYAIFRVLSI